jgi:chitosanase
MTDLQIGAANAIINVYETGAPRARYDTVTVMKGDTGHLSYGRCQASLTSGSLFQLLHAYCSKPEAAAAEPILPFLDRLRARDASLDGEAALCDALKAAGSDPCMQLVQDAYFYDNYFAPARSAASACGVHQALGVAVVFDSFVQGNFARLRRAVLEHKGAVNSNFSEQAWVVEYVAARREWLAGSAAPLCNTVYRMDGFQGLIDAGKWDLALPFTVRGVQIDEAAVMGRPVARLLRLRTPNLTGDDVKVLQEALAERGYSNTPDGVFGTRTDAQLKSFQLAQGLDPDGIAGPRTCLALGI